MTFFRSFQPHNKIISGIALVIFSATLLVYIAGIVDTNGLASFSRYYADGLFLALVIVSIAMQLRATSSLVDPIYWLLLGSAFSSWFFLTLFHFFFWDSLTIATQNLISTLAYFLFYSLMIAAIEVKSYQRAKELLEGQNLLIWISTFAFTLGAFVFLVLTSDSQASHSNATFHNHFIFYLLMDCYLFFRWMHLAWVCRRSFWLAYGLLAIAALNWAVADLTEGLHIAQQLEISAGSWQDWIWYSPYAFVFLATQIRVSSSSQQNKSRDFSKSHLLNSPLFFLAVCFILHNLIEGNPQLLVPLNSTQHTIFNLWFSLLLLLAVVQMLQLVEQVKHKQNRLRELSVSTKAIEQRLTQQAQSLKDQAASNEAILETTHNAIFTLDNGGHVLSCNPAACQLLGLSQSEILTKNFIEITQAEGELARYFNYQSYQQKLVRQASGVEIESIISSANGETLPVHATLSKDTKHREGQLVVSLINISEQKRAEEEALNLKDQFTANISHEFRTPLTIINGVVDNLIAREEYQADKPQLLTAKRNGLRMLRMVEQLLDLSRIANDPIPLSAMNIQPAIKFACQSFSEIANNQQIELELDISDEAWIDGNAQALEKILFNLLSNAFKYTRKGTVSVSLVQQDDFYQLIVADTGIGMAPEQLGQIFERFHRVDNAATQSVHGVGIGLSLVKELCDAMGWSLDVESTPGKGSRFIVMLPATQAKIETCDPGDIQSSETPLASELLDSQELKQKKPGHKSKYSVLIVEDNHDMQQHIHQILSQDHHCLLADNGDEALRLALDYLPDIIVSDVMMPGISGFDLLKAIKQNGLTTHIPVILLTARGDSASKIRGLESEADDYLSKPFDAAELSLRVNNQLNSRAKLQRKLVNQWQQIDTGGPVEKIVEDKFLRKLDEAFDSHYQNSHFSVQDLAYQLAMSDRQVQRKVKAMLGISPLEALKQFRLKKARAMLASGDQIGVVAQTCGFSSQSYFGRCFKEEFKMTPKAYQQSNRV